MFLKKIMQSRFNGFIAIDGMVSLVPILLMLVILMETVSFFSDETAKSSHSQKILNKLLAIADYTVKSGAVVHEGEARYPNWLDEQKLDENFTETLRQKTGLSSLYLGVSEPAIRYPICIYRIVVTGNDKKIKQLFVCGG